LPPGITGGIAQLVEAKLGTYAKGANQGEQFVYLAGAVKSPKEINVVRRVFQDGRVVNLPVETVPILGLRTAQTLPLCDTTNAAGETTDLDEHVRRMENELRKLGGDDFTADIGDEESLASALEALKEAAPHFKFSTSSRVPTAQYPSERVWENWRGAVDYVEDEDNSGVVDEATSEEPEVSPPAKSSKKQAPVTEEETEEEEEGEEVDLVALARRADKKYAGAQAKLTELARSAGLNEEDYETWKDVAEAISSAGGEEEEAEDEGDDEPAPEKGEVYFYKPPKAKKRVECEVVAVFSAKQLVNLKNLDDHKTVYKAVPWDAISAE